MDMDTTLLYRELQRIANAFEANNELQRKGLELSEKNVVLLENSIEIQRTMLSSMEQQELDDEE